MSFFSDIGGAIGGGAKWLVSAGDKVGGWFGGTSDDLRDLLGLGGGGDSGRSTGGGGGTIVLMQPNTWPPWVIPIGGVIAAAIVWRTVRK